MENDAKAQSQKNNDSQQGNEYYGYASADLNLSDEEKDQRLAEKGPIRNSNYHDLNDKHTNSVNKYRKVTPNIKIHGTDGKTLEDYNDTEPKRASNKVISNETGNPE